VDLMDWGSSTEDSFTGRNSVTDAVLDMRDAPPPSLANESFRDTVDHHGAFTPGTPFSTAGCSSRSSIAGDASQRRGGDVSHPLGNLEQLLQALFVEGGFLEEGENRAGEVEGEPSMPSSEPNARNSNGDGLPPEPTADSSLLASLSRGNAGPQLTLEWLLRLSQQADGEAVGRNGRGRVPSLGGLLSGRTFVVDSTASPSTSGFPTARTAMMSASPPASFRFPVPAESAGFNDVASSSDSPDSEVLSDSGLLQTDLFPIQWEESRSQVDGDAESEMEDNVVSVFDVSDGVSSARLLETTEIIPRDGSQNPGHPSSPSWDSGTGVWSTVSSARTHTSVRPASAGARSPMGLREATEIALLNGSLTSMLQRLTNSTESQLLDESLTRSVRRVLQLGTLLAGERLSDEEIRALPKVRFESTEQQHCAICLEAYQDGELVTSLPCDHFFHIDCVGRWMQKSTLCPLCRKPCCAEHE